jgi:two-component system, OmpR family, response regulator RegX3
MLIAILEDEKSLSDDLEALLKKDGHEVSAFADGLDLVKSLSSETYDMFILDWKVPGMDGFEVLKHIRSELGFKTPVIFLTSNNQEEDIVSALSSGADDYSIKPLRPSELLARLNALMRRTYGIQKKTNFPETIADYTFTDFDRAVSFGDQKVSLTDKEFLLAHYFFSNIDRPLSRNHIMMRIWGQNAEGLTRTLDVHVAWIRNKLGIGATGDKLRLVAIHGYGYRLMQVEA